MKSVLQLTRLLLKFLLLCCVDIQESFGKGDSKFNFLGIIWERKSSRRVHFFKLSESLKLKVLATMEPRPGYTGLITNL